jgi:hypothetical protein
MVAVNDIVMDEARIVQQLRKYGNLKQMFFLDTEAIPHLY